MSREEITLDTHEFVVGNKQLISLFFIAVILLGAFFTMGYFVGRNSSPVLASSEPAEEPGVVPRPAAIITDSKQPGEGSPGVIPPPPPSPEAPVIVTEPQIGRTYVQVISVGKSEAEVLAAVLAKKGFEAFVAPGPNEKLFRVLVGPAKDDIEAAKLRGEIASAIGAKPFIKKY